jgi:hypothetical protein
MGAGGELRTTGDSKKLNFFHVRTWLGMPLGVWLRAWRENGWKLDAARLPQAIRLTLFSLFNTGLHWADRLVYDRPVARGPQPKPPLFIVGHWRTGTTLLHELMVLDRQFGYPTTYQVMAPHHFLVSDGFVPALLAHALPGRRPMDNVEMGFDRPQEDEFAFCHLGLPSPYLKWLFPNTSAGDGTLDLLDLSEGQRREWLAGMRLLLRRLAFRDPRRQVLKSPTHTARVGVLAREFPGAQFVHITRDPRAVFPSTVHTWKQLWDSMGFQVPNFAGIEEYVLATFDRMYRAFDRDRANLGDRQLVELKYEDLIRDPVGEVGRVYERLGLEGFESARPKLEEFAAKSKGYRTNRHEMPDELRRKIADRWRGYCERYGYDMAKG